MDKATVDMLRLIHEEAQRAYWRTTNDCGSDYKDSCSSYNEDYARCANAEQCKAQRDIESRLDLSAKKATVNGCSEGGHALYLKGTTAIKCTKYVKEAK